MTLFPCGADYLQYTTFPSYRRGEAAGVVWVAGLWGRQERRGGRSVGSQWSPSAAVLCHLSRLVATLHTPRLHLHTHHSPISFPSLTTK